VAAALSLPAAAPAPVGDPCVASAVDVAAVPGVPSAVDAPVEGGSALGEPEGCVERFSEPAEQAHSAMTDNEEHKALFMVRLNRRLGETTIQRVVMARA
jgi:hypothetical protein